MTAATPAIATERAADRHGETKLWNGPMDDNRDYHRSLANSLIDDLGDEDAWDMAIEFGWDGVVAQLGGRARHQIAHDAAQY
jgi:hypothetical protein